jgi:hypothetical protein
MLLPEQLTHDTVLSRLVSSLFAQHEHRLPSTRASETAWVSSFVILSLTTNFIVEFGLVTSLHKLVMTTVKLFILL